MTQKEIKFSFQVFDSAEHLSPSDLGLLGEAKKALGKSYSPYSHFKVGAAALLQNGEIVSAANQENASYPAGICAESAALMVASSMFPEIPISAMAVTVKSDSKVVNHPVGPCGICRQRMLEYEVKFDKPINIILMGETGKIYKVNSVKDLLPLNFSNHDLL